jgi:aldose 1-epimerase
LATLVPTTPALSANIIRADWGTTNSGQNVSLYTLTGKGGLRARISDFGGDIVNLDLPNRQGGKTNTMLGFDNFESYQEGSVFGAVI